MDTPVFVSLDFLVRTVKLISTNVLIPHVKIKVFVNMVLTAMNASAKLDLLAQIVRFSLITVRITLVKTVVLVQSIIMAINVIV